jgi:non-specific serine/threonine protein kinase
LEEKIDTLIESKQRMTREVLEGSGSDLLITEMSNEELLGLVSLDLKAALAE